VHRVRPRAPRDVAFAPRAPSARASARPRRRASAAASRARRSRVPERPARRRRRRGRRRAGAHAPRDAFDRRRALEARSTVAARARERRRARARPCAAGGRGDDVRPCVTRRLRPWATTARDPRLARDTRARATAPRPPTRDEPRARIARRRERAPGARETDAPTRARRERNASDLRWTRRDGGARVGAS